LLGIKRTTLLAKLNRHIQRASEMDGMDPVIAEGLGSSAAPKSMWMDSGLNS
jgi:uncharacterized hydantoinase/oxoprolinase family protein